MANDEALWVFGSSISSTCNWIHTVSRQQSQDRFDRSEIISVQSSVNEWSWPFDQRTEHNQHEAFKKHCFGDFCQNEKAFWLTIHTNLCTLWHQRNHGHKWSREKIMNKFCCNCFQAAADLRDFYGHWFRWCGRVIRLWTCLSARECSISPASDPAPGKCQVEFSAWVHGMCTEQPSLSADYSTWSSPSQNADRPERWEMKGGIHQHSNQPAHQQELQLNSDQYFCYVFF